MIIRAFKDEFARIADIVGASFTTKEIQEEQDYAQNYEFIDPWINWQPIINLTTEIDQGGGTVYVGTCIIRFLTKARTDDTFEDHKDEFIDDMISLAQEFYFNLYKNSNGVFVNPEFTNIRHNVLRQYLSNYLVGTEVTMDFRTSCASRGFNS